MKIFSSKVVALGLIAVLVACSSTGDKEKGGESNWLEQDTAWGLIGNKDLDDAGLLLSVACVGAKVELQAWLAKNNGCVQYGQFKNEVAAAMAGVENPTKDQIKEAEVNAMSLMSADDRVALKAHCDTMGNESGAAAVKVVGGLAAAVELTKALKGAKDSITGNAIQKMTKAKMFVDGLGQVAELSTFLKDIDEQTNVWKTSYGEWGNAINEI